MRRLTLSEPSTAAITNLRRRAITLPSSSVIESLEKIARNACASEGLDFAALDASLGGADPGVSDVEFAILSPGRDVPALPSVKIRTIQPRYTTRAAIDMGKIAGSRWHMMPDYLKNEWPKKNGFCEPSSPPCPSLAFASSRSVLIRYGVISPQCRICKCGKKDAKVGFARLAPSRLGLARRVRRAHHRSVELVSCAASDSARAVLAGRTVLLRPQCAAPAY